MRRRRGGKKKKKLLFDSNSTKFPHDKLFGGGGGYIQKKIEFSPSDFPLKVGSRLVYLIIFVSARKERVYLTRVRASTTVAKTQVILA